MKNLLVLVGVCLVVHICNNSVQANPHRSVEDTEEDATSSESESAASPVVVGHMPAAGRDSSRVRKVTSHENKSHEDDDSSEEERDDNNSDEDDYVRIPMTEPLCPARPEEITNIEMECAREYQLWKEQRAKKDMTTTSEPVQIEEADQTVQLEEADHAVHNMKSNHSGHHMESEHSVHKMKSNHSGHHMESEHSVHNMKSNHSGHHMESEHSVHHMESNHSDHHMDPTEESVHGEMQMSSQDLTTEEMTTEEMTTMTTEEETTTETMTTSTTTTTQRPTTTTTVPMRRSNNNNSGRKHKRSVKRKRSCYPATCILKKLNLLDSMGQPSIKRIQKFAVNMTVDDSMNLEEKAVECVKEINEAMIDASTDIGKKVGCVAQKVITCMNKGLTCPIMKVPQ